MSDAQGRVYVTVKGDPRKLGRNIKAAEARLVDVERPKRGEDLQRLLDPASVVRKALGEFDGA